ncbi:3',5'-cyclic AMP phosphodiesterase CpdA [Litorivivens lipolytica]|uniref:3',5'-cyclic AMP phosphodiesterase CpdA n=1 Tax=Litorivivens lipolytica TaxID=1524264 RepID=A0A7W4Z630_9GAMM|nr:metallophosphoesterase family protein [Litorivivens lipolytica]MBB3048109.1 3',5'-cyclic AMP phosphodiesterase CpdA [Litorivivens lipolytica]
MSSSEYSRRRFLAASASSLALIACGEDSDSPSPISLTDPGPQEPTNPPVTPPAASHPPRGAHVSFTGHAQTSRSVTWFTDGDQAPISFLEFDSVESGMDEEAIANTPFRHRIESRVEPTTGVEALTHRASAGDLPADKAFRYRIGSDIGGWSPVRVVQPIPGDSWSFIHYGDQGTGPLAKLVTDEVLKTPSDLVLIAGDLSYADGTQTVWDTWFDQQEALLAQRPMLAAPGNHEEKDFGGDAFKNRFTHPGKPFTSIITGDNPGSSFYSFDVNRVHFLVTTAGALINDGTLPEELLNIEADLSLAAVRRAAGEIDFIVVMQHFPIWTDQDGRSPANPALVALEENIIVRYGVDLLLVGHDHIYQRSQPMSFGQVNPLGYLQVMVGTGGASIRLFDADGPQAWSVSEFVGIGFARYEVTPGKIAVEFVGAPPLGMSDKERRESTGEFKVEDRFEVTARDWLACRDCVQVPRTRMELVTLLRDYTRRLGGIRPHYHHHHG